MALARTPYAAARGEGSGRASYRLIDREGELLGVRADFASMTRVSRRSVRTGELEQQIVKLERVGLYVPGAAAVYLSTLVMCGVPVRIAGVSEIVVATSWSCWGDGSLCVVAGDSPGVS